MKISLQNITGTAYVQHYDNASALDELRRMIENRERLDLRFSLDPYKRPRVRIESKATDYFYLLLNQDIVNLIFDYLYYGESDMIVENPNEIECDEEATGNSFELEMFQQMIEHDPTHMQNIPIPRNKPGYISAYFRYSWGKIFFRMERTPELEELIAKHLPKRK